MSRLVDTPWKPATIATRPASSASRIRSARISTIFALPWSVSVTIPACEPVNETAGTPSASTAMHSSAIEIRSPAVSSMSISRPPGALATSLASRTRSSVVFPIAETTAITSSPAAPGTGDVVGDGADPVRDRATDVPPNFWTTNTVTPLRAVGAYGDRGCAAFLEHDKNGTSGVRAFPGRVFKRSATTMSAL